MRNEKAEADSEPSGKRWVRNDGRSVEWVGFCAAVLAVEIEDAALKGRLYTSAADHQSEHNSCEADGECGNGGGRKDVVDSGVADCDGGGLRDDGVAMVEGVVRVNVGMSEDGGRAGSGGCSANDNFGFARLRNAGIDDGEVKVLPF